MKESYTLKYALFAKPDNKRVFANFLRVLALLDLDDGYIVDQVNFAMRKRFGAV